MSDFDERSGIVPCVTEWGQWWQTMEEIFIEVNVPEGSRAKDIKCDMKPSTIKVVVQGNVKIEGELTGKVHAAECIWTLEDRKFLRICLPKTNPSAASCWRSLVVGKYEADPMLFDEMERKMTLQKYQMQNPGMDFSGATVTGNYHGGGPTMET